MNNLSVRTVDVLSSMTSYGSMSLMSVPGCLSWEVTIRTVYSSPLLSRTMTGRFFAPDLSSKYRLAFHTSMRRGSAPSQRSILGLMGFQTGSGVMILAAPRHAMAPRTNDTRATIMAFLALRCAVRGSEKTL